MLRRRVWPWLSSARAHAHAYIAWRVSVGRRVAKARRAMAMRGAMPGRAFGYMLVLYVNTRCQTGITVRVVSSPCGRGRHPRARAGEGGQAAAHLGMHSRRQSTCQETAAPNSCKVRERGAEFALVRGRGGGRWRGLAAEALIVERAHAVAYPRPWKQRASSRVWEPALR